MNLPTLFSTLIVAALTMASGLAAPAKKAASPANADAAKVGAAVYFLTEAVSVTTDAGIASAPAGTKVTRVGPAPGGMKVKTADGTTFNVTAKQITEDAGKGAELLSGEAAKQAAIAAQAKANSAAAQAEEAERQRVALQAAQAAQAAAPATAPAATFTPPPAAAAGAGGGSGLQGTSLDEKPKPAGIVHRPRATPQPIIIRR